MALFFDTYLPRTTSAVHCPIFRLLVSSDTCTMFSSMDHPKFDVLKQQRIVPAPQLDRIWGQSAIESFLSASNSQFVHTFRHGISFDPSQQHSCSFFSTKYVSFLVYAELLSLHMSGQSYAKQCLQSLDPIGVVLGAARDHDMVPWKKKGFVLCLFWPEGVCHTTKPPPPKKTIVIKIH